VALKARKEEKENLEEKKESPGVRGRIECSFPLSGRVRDHGTEGGEGKGGEGGKKTIFYLGGGRHRGRERRPREKRETEKERSPGRFFSTAFAGGWNQGEERGGREGKEDRSPVLFFFTTFFYVARWG